MDSKSVIHSLSQFVNAVEEMEQAILVPQSLQDMSLSSNNGVVLEKSLLEAFTVLRNLKNVVLTEQCSSKDAGGEKMKKRKGNRIHSQRSTGWRLTVAKRGEQYDLLMGGHALDEESDGNPISDELLSMTKTLGKMTGLAKNLTDEYKKNFNLLF